MSKHAGFILAVTLATLSPLSRAEEPKRRALNQGERLDEAAVFATLLPLAPGEQPDVNGVRKM